MPPPPLLCLSAHLLGLNLQIIVDRSHAGGSTGQFDHPHFLFCGFHDSIAHHHSALGIDIDPRKVRQSIGRQPGLYRRRDSAVVDGLTGCLAGG